MDDPMEARLKPYVIDSNEALDIKLIRKEDDLEDDDTSFSPEMSHQVFGDSETIFGYKDLQVQLYYSAGSLETYLGMKYTEKLHKGEFDDVEPDDVFPKLMSKLTPPVYDNLDTFIKALSKDEKFKPSGELLHSFTVNDNGNNRQFEVYKADMTCPGFKEYHDRLQMFILWYIDAASFIDVDDDQWHYFNMYEKFTLSGHQRYATIGFATVYQYYAYPNHTRPRIAQVLILPPFQKLGLCANLLRAIYRHYIGSNEVKDITVEDPAIEFQRVRDYVDAINCMKLPSFSRESLIQGFNKDMVNEARDKYKINKRQSRRIYEILRLRMTDLSNEQEYRDYRLDVKKRLNSPYKRGLQDMKRLESLGSVAIPPPEQRIQSLEKEYRSLEEDYKKVIRRLEETSEQ